MADRIDLDFAEVNALVVDLGKAAKVVPEKIAAHLDVTAIRVEKDWKEPLKGSATVPAGAASITHDIEGVASAILGRSAMSAEIGPVLRGQGPVVGMLEYGTPNTGPRGFGAAALKKNDGFFVDGISNIAGDIL